MIDVKNEAGLTQITLNRPEKANALNAEMLSDLIKAFRTQTQNSHAIILTGRGRTFSAGADLEAARNGLAVSPLWEELSGTIAESPALTIAALNGSLAGGAFGMALACDIRICTPKARFFYPVMKLGFLPQPSDPARLASLLGPARAKMILMGGAKIEANEALAWGLVERICDESDLLPTAHNLCDDALAARAEHVQAIKKLF